MIADQYSVRMAKLKEKIAENGLKGVFLVPGPNMRYYTGGNSLLLERPFFMAVPLDGEPRLVTPTLEAGPYIRSPLKIDIHSWSDADGPSKAIREAVAGFDFVGRWGLQGDMPYAFVDLILKFVQPQFENANPILQNIRAVKDAQEVRLLTRSVAMLSRSFLAIPNMLRAGMTELELAQKIAYEIHSNGAESVPDILVQSGAMAADGHHLPCARRLKRRESIVVDASCTFGGYFADITRTFLLGRDDVFEKLYATLLDAQIAAVKASRPGTPVGLVDEAARSILRTQNLESYFVHRTGHGLGLQVHEEPYIVPNGTELLQPSMAFTVEPGIYMQGKTGLRIEDNLVTNARRSVVLSKSIPKEYGWWN